MTNGDRIRQMSNEELAEIFSCNEDKCMVCNYDGSNCNHFCEEGIKAYLESEVE